jgi:hypothetical protein
MGLLDATWRISLSRDDPLAELHVTRDAVADRAAPVAARPLPGCVGDIMNPMEAPRKAAGPARHGACVVGLENW